MLLGEIRDAHRTKSSSNFRIMKEILGNGTDDENFYWITDEYQSFFKHIPRACGHLILKQSFRVFRLQIGVFPSKIHQNLASKSNDHTLPRKIIFSYQFYLGCEIAV